MKNYLRYFINFLMPLLLLSTCLVGFSVLRSGSLDAFGKLLIAVAAGASFLLAVGVSAPWYFSQIRPRGQSFAVSSDKGKKRALDALETLMTEEFTVKRVALRAEECFSGEISFMRGLIETVSIRSEGASLTVFAPKKIMDSVERLMKEMQWDI